MYSFLSFLLLSSSFHDLSHEDWLIREGAQERLQRAMPFAGPWVKQEVGRGHKGLLCDPEAMRRAQEVVLEWEGLPRCRCMFELLGIPTYHMYYHESGYWYLTWDIERRPGPYDRKEPRAGRDVDLVLRPDQAWLFHRYLEPLKIRTTDAQWHWDDSHIATRRFALDLLRRGVPKALVRRWLCEP